MNLDDKICYCFHITRRKLVNWVRRHSPQVPSQLSLCGGAGTGCGWCIPFLKQIFRAELAARGGCSACRAAPDDSLDRLTAEEYAARRAEYIARGQGTPPPGAEPPPSADSAATNPEGTPDRD